ncbi:MAG: sulfatase [Myxococcota bacterium]|nr:sulfatase [Myxococcota bacterium]
MSLLAAILQLGCSPRSVSQPDLLLITIDTLRADFVHSYGFSREITPNMDALAAQGVLFETAIAASTVTVPAHASIMSSRYVREHSVGYENGATRLAGVTTLAESLRAAGYDTAGFVSNVVLKTRTGLDRGFDVYDDRLSSGELNRPDYFERSADATVGRALAWLAQPRERPFFLWVHLQDPHGPYAPPPDWADVAEEIPLRVDRELPVLRWNRGRGGIPAYQALDGIRRAPQYAGLYAGEIAFTDHWVGKLVAAVDRDQAVIALTADHGESLDEDGFFFQHGHTTTPEQVLVPLIFVASGIAPGRIEGVASHVDIAPTLLELAGLAVPEAASGISLVPVLRGEAPLPDRAVLSDIGHELSAYDSKGYLTVKVLDPDPPDWQRFERVEGGWRKSAASPLPPAIRDYLSSAVAHVPAHAMSDEDVERLRALGYLPPAPVEE